MLASMPAPIRKLLTCFVFLAVLCSQQLAGPLLIHAGPAMWNHDGHHHTMSVMETGDSFVLILGHLTEENDVRHHDLADDDEEDDCDPATENHNFTARHTHPDHVLAFSASKFSPWQPTAATLKSLCWAEIPFFTKEEAPLTSIGVFLGIGAAARPPPWSQHAFQCALRATVMMV